MEEIKRVEPSGNGFKSRVEAVASVIMWEDISTGAVRYSDAHIEDYMQKAQARIEKIARENKKKRRNFAANVN